MVRAFLMLCLSILPAFALAESCDAHTPDEGSMAVQLMGARSLIDSLDDVGRPGASVIFAHEISKTSCPKTLAPTGGRSNFHDYNASAQKCIGNNVAYMKVPKTGSSTVAGIFRRIAARNGLYGVDVSETCTSQTKMPPFQEPAVCADHIERFNFLQRSMFRLPLLLFATVRKPLDRALSYRAWLQRRAEVGNRSKHLPIEDDPHADIKNIQHMLASQYRYVANSDPAPELARLRRQGVSVDDWGWSPDDTNMFLLPNATDILADYQVVGQTDRMSETALLMAFSLKLTTLGDVLIVCTKCTEKNGGTTHSLLDLPESLRDWIGGNEYKHIVKRDQELYDAAGRKMDKQIGMVNDALKQTGHNETFGQILGRYEFHLRTVALLCEKKAGEKQTCYFEDNGCGWPCLDMYSTNHSMQLVLPVI